MRLKNSKITNWPRFWSADWELRCLRLCRLISKSKSGSAFPSEMRLSQRTVVSAASLKPRDPTQIQQLIPGTIRYTLTSSRELLMNPPSRSNAKSFTLGIFSSQGVKLYTRDRGSCSQCTPGLTREVKKSLDMGQGFTNLNKTRSSPWDSVAIGWCSETGGRSEGVFSYWLRI